MSPRLLPLLLLGALCVQCRSAPTTVLLRVEAEVGFPLPEELRLNVYGAAGLEVSDRRLPDEGRPTLPGEVVLYPRAPGQLRLLVRAIAGGSRVGEGAVQVEAVKGKQVQVTLTLTTKPVADRDGDQVPDLVDNCPDAPNPQQGPCPKDGGVDAAAADASAEGRRDLSPDLDCDHDKDGYLAASCGGNDCDDTNAKINPGAQEGPPGDATCSDGVDNDCDGGKDLADTACHSCTSDSECDDKASCTADTCSGGVCKNTPTNEGKACTTGNLCTSGTTCKSGLCTGGGAVSCPAAPLCKTSSCDPAKGCVTANAPNGTTCDDAFCTTGKSCTSGVCTGGKARDCSVGAPACQVANGCDETNDKCLYTPTKDGAPCDDKNACTQGETCTAGTCTAPATLIETVDAVGTTSGTDRAIRVDATGVVSTTYQTMNSGPLRFATNASGSWVTEAIDTVTSASPSLVFEGGLPHVAFIRGGQVRYGVRGAPWTADSVDSGESHAGAAVDGSGAPHIAYQRNNRLYWAYRISSGNWKTQLVDDGGGAQVGYSPSLAIDKAGKLHIAHTRGTMSGYVNPAALRYSTNASGTWVTSEPAVGSGIAGHGGFPSLALGSSGQVYITHTDNCTFSSAGGTLYLTSSSPPSSWTTTTLGTPAELGNFSSLIVSASGALHVVYRQDTSPNVLRYATNAGGTWTFKTIDTLLSDSTVYPTLAQEPSGRLHVVYKGGLSGPHKHAAFSACP